MIPPYDFLRDQIDSLVGDTIGFNYLVAPAPYELEPATLAGFHRRYNLIREFQRVTLSLFKASLRGECHPRVSELILNE